MLPSIHGCFHVRHRRKYRTLTSSILVVDGDNEESIITHKTSTWISRDGGHVESYRQWQYTAVDRHPRIQQYLCVYYCTYIACTTIYTSHVLAIRFFLHKDGMKGIIQGLHYFAMGKKKSTPDIRNDTCRAEDTMLFHYCWTQHIWYLATWCSCTPGTI